MRWLGGGASLFLLSMFLVILADNAFTFLLVWELMAVVSFALVVHDHHDGAVRRAGFVYLVMSHADPEEAAFVEHRKLQIRLPFRVLSP